jgi:D-alanine-D-alanine ligase
MTRSRFLPVLHGAAADRPDEADTIVTAQAVSAALQRLGYDSEIIRLGLDLSAVGALAAAHPALVFNLVEALDGDSALAQLAPAALDHFGLAYTGSGLAAHHLTITKTAAKRLLDSAGLPTPRWSLDGSGFAAGERVIVKSNTEHASLGLDAASVVAAAGARREIAARELRFGGPFFAEAFVEGREFNLSLLETAEGPRVLPVAEILFVDFPADRPRIVDYEAKWATDSAVYANTPRSFDFAAGDAALIAELDELALAAWRLFGLAGYARVDFRVDAAGRPTILEVNLNPCLAPDAGFVAAAARAGLDYDAVISSIVTAAKGRRREAA